MRKKKKGRFENDTKDENKEKWVKKVSKKV